MCVATPQIVKKYNGVCVLLQCEKTMICALLQWIPWKYRWFLQPAVVTSKSVWPVHMETNCAKIDEFTLVDVYSHNFTVIMLNYSAR